MKGSIRISRVSMTVCFLLLIVWNQGYAEGLRVGVILPLTGRLAELGGETAYRSFQMAAAEINETGGIHGEKLELLFEDTAGDPEVGLRAVEKLISKEKVPILSGGISSTVPRPSRRSPGAAPPPR